MGQMEYVRIIRNLREDADKTQTQIAQVLGTSQTMYARYERGASEMPNPASGYPVPLLRRFGRLCAGPETGKIVKAGACGAQPQAPAFSF